jgi:hypothetical protein
MQSAVAGDDVQLGRRIEARAAVPDIWIMPRLILVGPHSISLVMSDALDGLPAISGMATSQPGIT